MAARITTLHQGRLLHIDSRQMEANVRVIEEISGGGVDIEVTDAAGETYRVNAIPGEPEPKREPEPGEYGYEEPETP